MDEEMRADFQRYADQELAKRVSALYGGLLAVGRDAEAQEAADRLLETLDQPDARTALVRAGTDIAERALPIFTQWLDEAEAAGGRVRTLRKRIQRIERKAESDSK